MAAVEDLVNQALQAAGWPKRIGNIYEGSKASIAALEIYGQTRDELIDSGSWEFARRGNIPLVALKGPPPAGGFTPAHPWSNNYPPPGWLYTYAHPSDMIEPLAVMPTPGPMFDLDPQPATWRVDNDSSFTPARKVIQTKFKGAIAVYRAQIIDPLTWQPGFTSALIEALAAKLAKALGIAREVVKDEQAEGLARGERAISSRG